MFDRGGEKMILKNLHLFTQDSTEDAVSIWSFPPAPYSNQVIIQRSISFSFATFQRLFRTSWLDRKSIGGVAWRHDSPSHWNHNPFRLLSIDCYIRFLVIFKKLWSRDVFGCNDCSWIIRRYWSAQKAIFCVTNNIGIYVYLETSLAFENITSQSQVCYCVNFVMIEWQALLNIMHSLSDVIYHDNTYWMTSSANWQTPRGVNYHLGYLWYAVPLWVFLKSARKYLR